MTRQVDAQHPFGDVRERQVADVLDVRREFHHGVQGERVGEHHPVGEDDALGLAGGAGGVDDGQRVLGPGGVEFLAELLRRRLSEQRRVRHMRRLRSRVGHHQPFQRGAGVGQQRFPHRELPGSADDGEARAAVAGDVGDLLGGGGAVDADRDRAEADQRQVRQPVLGPVGHHQQHMVPAADAEGPVAGGEGAGVLVDLAPAERGPVGVRVLRLPGQARQSGVGVRVAGQELGQGAGGGVVGRIACGGRW
ncbi:hypothetical protein GCM10019016_022280 [Streptomyces prasinosporus]|uniref:Uncharacterized protein n=1 Tax=Streptomyces prasinosporus TaxID=68256 RepID=A0ABP6TK55_9ACTN